MQHDWVSIRFNQAWGAQGRLQSAECRSRLLAGSLPVPNHGIAALVGEFAVIVDQLNFFLRGNLTGDLEQSSC